MDIRPKVRNAALMGALAAIAATAWAANETMSTTTAYVPATRVAEVPAPAGVTVNESLSPNESVMPSSEPVAAPVVERSVAQPPITIERQRLTEDQRIQADVMDRLASSRYISGKIGVESHDAVVRLYGYTSTAGQADRAGRDARNVIGVRYVQNEIRPRIGGSVS
jgi:hyperosmotically inducible periplasmic protein